MSEITPDQSINLLRLSAYEDGYADGYNTGWLDCDGPQRMVREFHEATGLAVDAEDTDELRTFREDLIHEECREVSEALVGEDLSLEAVAKELADLAYVLYGTAVSLGIDLDEALRRVHASNMSKLGDDGHALRREDGKILKGPNYQPPDMTGVVRDAVD